MTFSLKPIWGKRLIGRESEITDIINTVKNSKTGTALYGVRRVGKTSILREVKERLSDDSKFKTIYLSLWELIPFSMSNFLQEFLICVLDSFLGDKISIKFRELMKLELPTMTAEF